MQFYDKWITHANINIKEVRSQYVNNILCFFADRPSNPTIKRAVRVFSRSRSSKAPLSGRRGPLLRTVYWLKSFCINQILMERKLIDRLRGGLRECRRDPTADPTEHATAGGRWTLSSCAMILRSGCGNCIRISDPMHPRGWNWARGSLMHQRKGTRRTVCSQLRAPRCRLCAGKTAQ